MSKFIVAALSLGVLSVFSGGAQANLITNGSFESDPTKVVDSGVYKDYGSWIRLAPGTSYLTGWTVTGFGSGSVQGVDWHLGTGIPKPAKDGLRMIDLHIDGTGGQGPGQGTIAQSFSTIVGEFYKLAFWLAAPDSSGQGGSLNPRTVVVDINGDSFQFQAPASDPNAQVWNEKTVEFQAIAATTTLKFSPPANTGQYGFWGAFLDNVSVVQTSGGGPDPGGDPVPAPATALLLGAGLVGLGLSRRAR